MTPCRPIVNRFVAALLSLTPAMPDAWAASPTEPASKERVTRFIVKVKASATPQSTHSNTGEQEAHAALARRAIERVLHEKPVESPPAGRVRRSPQYVIETRPMSGAAHVVTLSSPVREDTANEIAARLQSQPEIEYAEPDYLLHRQLAPSDPLYEKQWGLRNAVGAARFHTAWDTTTGSSEAIIAVVDTGYRPHPDLVANLLPGYDFLTNPVIANDGDGRDADASDPGDWVTEEESLACDGTDRWASNSSWHGTHVAGTIGAVANNEIGGAGGVWQARILPVRALGKCGGPASDIIDALRWAVGLPVPGVPANAHPAKIVNMSLGTSQPCGRAMQAAIDDVLAQGATLVAAAGNGGIEVGEPASCRGAIAVAAIDADGKMPAFSNFGARIDIGAPGVGILSTSNAGLTVPGDDTYRTQDGTSMAAPHVSAAVALMLAASPSLTPSAIREKLRASARAFPADSNCAAKEDGAQCGVGMLDAAAALVQPEAAAATNR
ncbi:S8 family peptidase [Trinickia diaoshuihuensis]|uniref:S8 family peptidase n=1 Tax=Trinickia diaoshuihuensis TaxID=2292265 RepID=UPI0013C2E324|nr:S8 family peptidase [Trinickia diaoshuihuensis]